MATLLPRSRLRSPTRSWLRKMRLGVVESHSLMPGSVLGFLPYKSGLMYLMAYDAAKLLLDAHNLHARSASAYEIADVAVRRNHARLTVIRGALRRQAQYHTARQLQVIVRQKLNADRLPCDSAARIYGAPGVKVSKRLRQAPQPDAVGHVGPVAAPADVCSPSRRLFHRVAGDDQFDRSPPAHGL